MSFRRNHGEIFQHHPLKGRFHYSGRHKTNFLRTILGSRGFTREKVLYSRPVRKRKSPLLSLGKLAILFGKQGEKQKRRVQGGKPLRAPLPQLFRLKSDVGQGAFLGCRSCLRSGIGQTVSFRLEKAFRGHLQTSTSDSRRGFLSRHSLRK